MAFKFDQTLMTVVRKDLENGNIPMLLGEPGIGKSSWIEALAELMHSKCFVLACNQLADKADLTGARLVPETVKTKDASGALVENTTYKQVFYPHEVIHDACKYAQEHPRETPILFMDELNRTTPDVTSEALSIPTMRKIGSAALPPNLRVMIAGNDKGNVTSLDEASVSRFVLYHVEPDRDTFIAVNPELNIFVKNVLMQNPTLLFCKGTTVTINTGNDDDDDKNGLTLDQILDEGEEMAQFTTPRTITAVSKWLNSFTNQELIQLLNVAVDMNSTSALQAGIESHVGQTNFSALLLTEITNNLMNTSNQANTLQVAKPACYDDMKACADMTALNEFIESMTDNDKSAAIVYALYEHQDNTRYLQALLAQTPALTPSDAHVVNALAAADKLDTENVSVATRSGTNIGNFVAMFIG